jgi:hypothetical protein
VCVDRFGTISLEKCAQPEEESRTKPTTTTMAGYSIRPSHTYVLAVTEKARWAVYLPGSIVRQPRRVVMMIWRPHATPVWVMLTSLFG